MTTITVTQDVTTVNVTATQSGVSVSLQPVIILGGGGGGDAGVQSVTGNIVDNTDPSNPTANAVNVVSADADNNIVLGSDDKLFVETPTEQDIVSTLIEPTIAAGAYTFDVSTGRAFKFAITEATTLTPPTLANSTALSFTALVTGDFTLTAASITITPTSDAYNGAVENRLIYDCYRTGAGAQTNILTIENLA